MKALLCSAILLLVTAPVVGDDLKTVAIAQDGKTVMTLAVPQAAKIIVKDGKTLIDAKDMTLVVWVVPKANTVADALANLDEIIKSEVLNFKPARTTPITVAGAAGKELWGKSIEADDHDPGTTDVVVFTVGKTVCVACVHGENEAAAQQRPAMLKALQTVKGP